MICSLRGPVLLIIGVLDLLISTKLMKSAQRVFCRLMVACAHFEIPRISDD